MSDKRKPARHGGPDGQSSAGRRLRRWGFRPTAVAPVPEAPERPAHLPPVPNSIPNHTPPVAHRPPPPPPPAHRPPPAGQAHRPPPPAPPLASRRHPSNVDAVPHAVQSPLPQRAARPPAGQPSTAAGEGSIDDINALMDFLRREDPPGA